MKKLRIGDKYINGAGGIYQIMAISDNGLVSLKHTEKEIGIDVYPEDLPFIFLRKIKGGGCARGRLNLRRVQN